MKKMILLVVMGLFLNYGVCLSEENVEKKWDISGPYKHQNLTVFLIHGNSAVDSGNTLTLEEAIEKKYIVIHETGSVNELTVENVSDNPVYIQAGDIVKGGRQDRTLQYDVVIQPKSGKVSVNSFCVEHGRWSKRGDEDAREFSSSKKILSSKKLKLAAKSEGSQGEVWEEVSKVQEKLSRNLGKSVKSAQSESSLQLTLEDKDIEKQTKAYVDAISELVKEKKGTIGFVFAINDEINSADIYGNATLFQKLFPKMLEACATEALSERHEISDTNNLAIEDIAKWMADAEKGKETKKDINKDNHLKIKDSESDMVFETYGKNKDGIWIHKNIIKK